MPPPVICGARAPMLGNVAREVREHVRPWGASRARAAWRAAPCPKCSLGVNPLASLGIRPPSPTLLTYFRQGCRVLASCGKVGTCWGAENQ